jgi:hypothetical protein
VTTAFLVHSRLLRPAFSIEKPFVFEDPVDEDIHPLASHKYFSFGLAIGLIIFVSVCFEVNNENSIAGMKC